MRINGKGCKTKACEVINKITQVNEEAPSGGYAVRTVKMVGDQTWEQQRQGNEGELFLEKKYYW